MKKKLFILLVTFCLTKLNVSQAQFTLGIRGGVNFSQLKTDSQQSVGVNIKQSLDTKTGYVGGVFARIGTKIFLQPELIFSAKGGSINVLPQNGTTTQTVAIEYNNLDVPLLIGLKFGPLRLNAGPVASFKISDKGLNDELKKYSSNVGESFKNASYGYQAGVGVDIGSFCLDLRYEGSLSDISSGDFKDNLMNKVTFSQKSNLWQVTLGLKLF
jgi:Outer membrane protein beta-barrel domain